MLSSFVAHIPLHMLLVVCIETAIYTIQNGAFLVEMRAVSTPHRFAVSEHFFLSV